MQLPAPSFCTPGQFRQQQAASAQERLFAQCMDPSQRQATVACNAFAAGACPVDVDAACAVGVKDPRLRLIPPGIRAPRSLALTQRLAARTVSFVAVPSAR
jgi:hypothetical protein